MNSVCHIKLFFRKWLVAALMVGSNMLMIGSNNIYADQKSRDSRQN